MANSRSSTPRQCISSARMQPLEFTINRLFLVQPIFCILCASMWFEDVSCSARIAVMFFQSQCENLLVELENNLQQKQRHDQDALSRLTIVCQPFLSLEAFVCNSLLKITYL